MQDTLRNRHQLAQRWMTLTIRSREHQQCRAAHRSHEQIQLLRTIARVDAALRDGPQVAPVTRSQDLVLEDMDVAWSSPLNPQEKLLITSTELWKKYLTASLKACKDELEKQTNSQIRENRRAMDRRARKANLLGPLCSSSSNLRVNGRNTALKKSCGGEYHMGSSG